MKKFIIISILILNFYNLFSQNKNESDTNSLKVININLNDYYTNDSSSLDTNQRFIQFFDPYEKNRIPIINLGQIGSPSIPMLFIDRNEYTDFLFLTPFEKYLYIPKNSEYYNTNKPLTNIKYISNLLNKYKEEQYLTFTLTQCPNNFTNFGIQYRLITAMDLSNTNQNSSINNLNIWYFKQIKKYKVYFSVFFNQIKHIENGGLIDNDSNFVYSDLRFNISNEPQNKIIYKGVFLNHSYDFSNKLKIRHTSNYYTYSKSFYEKTPNTAFFGQTRITDEQSYDSTGISSFDNTFALLLSKKENIVLAYTNKMQNAYYFRGFLYNLRGQFILDNILFLGLQKIQFKNLNLNLKAKYFLSNWNKGNFDIKSTIDYNLNFAENTLLSFELNLKKSTPNYFYDNYNGNYYGWRNNFNDINLFSVKFNSNFTKYNLNIGFDFREVRNYIYFNSLSLPTQDTNLLIVKTLWLKKTFNFKPFVLDLNLYYQIPTNQDIVHIPNIIASSSFFLDVPLFKKALILNFGANVYYYSMFYTYSYNPSLAMFYLTNTRTSGNYPIVNVFLTGKIQTAVIILRFDNALGWLIFPFQETVEHYHISDFYLRFGVQWWFRN